VDRPAPATTRPPRTVRLRPGERPTWWHADIDREHFPAWRATAAQQRLGVDVLVSLLVEFDLVLADLRPASTDPEALLASVHARPSEVRRLGPASALRGWLASALPIDGSDELPELVLPERLAVRLTPGTSLVPRLRFDRVGLAIACDRRAAEHGRTLESWALHAALRDGSRLTPLAGGVGAPFTASPQ
jgi:hypothetical protein